MGRSRGGLTTKIYALVDANRLPILLKLLPRQAQDGRTAAMLDGLGQGQILLLADRGYDSDALSARLARAVATRYEKHDATYRALVKLAAMPIGFRFISR
jgi:transposase